MQIQSWLNALFVFFGTLFWLAFLLDCTRIGSGLGRHTHHQQVDAAMDLATSKLPAIYSQWSDQQLGFVWKVLSIGTVLAPILWWSVLTIQAVEFGGWCFFYAMMAKLSSALSRLFYL